jgi:hypothetical protein
MKGWDLGEGFFWKDCLGKDLLSSHRLYRLGKDMQGKDSLGEERLGKERPG